MNLKNKVVVITGAASGIGRALAIQFAKKGCHLAISDINQEKLMKTAQLATNKDCRITQHVLDVSDKDAVYAFAQDVLTQHGKAHIVINNAGVTVMATVEHMSYEDFEWLMGINFWGVVYGTKAFLPILKKARDARIVNISSIFGILTVPAQSAYHSAKFAIRGFTESLRQELEIEKSRVKVCSVHPASIKTNIAKDSRVGEAGMFNKEMKKVVSNFTKTALTSPEKAARIIIEGVERGDPRILVGPDAYVLDMIQRLLPVHYPLIMQQLKRLGELNKLSNLLPNLIKKKA